MEAEDNSYKNKNGKDSYPFPASSHEVVLQPAQPGMFSYTLNEILNDEIILNVGQIEVCECGAVIPMPLSVKQMAARLTETYPRETQVSFAVKHLFDGSVKDLTKDEVVERLRAWMDRHYK